MERSLVRSKVFCVGFHKTGTKSLAQALRLLEYRVTGSFGIHDPDISVRALDKALILARAFDAFNDNPWPLLYRELDAAFPGSRFVLTLREPSRWICSAIRHFGGQETPT